jgi:uncharacterized protein with HEPN domain
MEADVKKYLFDIQISIESIFDFLGDRRDFFDYQNSKMLRRINHTVNCCVSLGY